MIFLFPNDFLNPKQPDRAYRDRFMAFKQAGFSTALIEIESLPDQNTTIYPALSSGDWKKSSARGSRVVYLGWMLSATEYQSLSKIIRQSGAIPFNSPTQYLNAHYLPNWYQSLQEFTPLTKIYSADDDLVAQLNQLDWQRFFIKDYVKSLKTGVGSIIEAAQQINTVIAEMKKYRGEIEGGICVRQVEDFITESEQRYFVINQQVFAANDNQEIPNIVNKCAARIDSNFFSVDLIKRQDGTDRIVEIGDGQVSDLVGWSISRFVQIWQTILN